MSVPVPRVPIMSTAGAVPVKNEKGQLSMEKVKVSRYVTGKRPDYAPESSDEEDEEIELNLIKLRHTTLGNTIVENENDLNSEVKETGDRRIRRLQERNKEDFEDEKDSRVLRHRQFTEPELLDRSDGEDSTEETTDLQSSSKIQNEVLAAAIAAGESSGEEEEELDEEEIERRREAIKAKMLNLNKDEELLVEEDENELSDDLKEDGEGADAESSEYEEYSGSEEEDLGPRLKPVFVRKKDRITIEEKEKEAQKLKDQEYEAKRMANERRQQTLKMVEAEIKRDMATKKTIEEDYDGLNSGDDNDEEEYEAWKVRELKRLKRDRDEREQIEKDKQELERIHNMTEEERKQEQKMNPKVVTNKAAKGKYKFLQKYYHRGVFFLDKEENVFKRDYTAPTLDDHFNKTVLPKVMQVKNFGRSGRTKYTHLVDQDTTQFESPWIADTSMNLKFHTIKGGGMKQIFDRPAVKRK